MMPLPVNASSLGRKAQRVFNNMDDDSDEEDEFVPNNIQLDRGAGPRAQYAYAEVLGVDMCVVDNNKKHNTNLYNNTSNPDTVKPLVARRGDSFQVKIKFDRVMAPEDFKLQFKIKDLKYTVNFGTNPNGTWRGEVLNCTTAEAVVEVTTPNTAVVGKYLTRVVLKLQGGSQHIKMENAAFYLLFNPWSPADEVYIPDPAGREEYVLNDYGIIYLGTLASYSKRPWFYNQFDEGILDTCLRILDGCRMAVSERWSALKVCRRGAEMINSQDNDNGVVVGSWGKTFPGGTSPLKWTSTKAILDKYNSSGVSVRYGQCWVFAAVFNTFLRCLGIPSRVVTNFNSAHDNDGNLRMDILYTMDYKKHPDTLDSIWNFHCWNEVYLRRKILPAKYSGWQCVDSTPQEASGGYYRCGPASVAAVKSGDVCFPFETPFIFAEVNSDVVHSTIDEHGVLTPFRTETRRVGQGLFTKGINTTEPDNITINYKFPEGSLQNENTMARAASFGCAGDDTVIVEGNLNILVKTLPTIMKGDDLEVEVVLNNMGDMDTEFEGSVKGSVVYYTGMEFSTFMWEALKVKVARNKVETLLLKIPRDQYMPHLGYNNTLQVMVLGASAGITINHETVVKLESQAVNFKLSGIPALSQQMSVELYFQNPFNETLHNIEMTTEGNGLYNYMTKGFGNIEPYGTVSWTVPFKPWRSGARYLFALLDSDELGEVWGIRTVYIAKTVSEI